MSEELLPRARLALRDGTEAAERLKARITSGESYRIDWAATVALLRVVGHVLHKVDGPANPAVAREVARAWREWNDTTRSEHAVYREFIEKERNNVLKQYEIGRFAPSHLLTEDGHRIMLEDGSGSILLETPDLDRVDSALAWWETQLTAIGSRIQAER